MLLEHLGAIRIRSDSERKRLFGFELTQPHFFTIDGLQAKVGRGLTDGGSKVSTE